MTSAELFFHLLRSEICGAELDKSIAPMCTEQMLQDVYAHARLHDLTHIAGQALSKLELPASETLTKLKSSALQAVYRYVRINHALLQACQVLEEEKIPFIPLKGSVLRDYYPEPWMRTSCDIDILVKEEMLEPAAQALSKKLGYKAGPVTDHDMTLTASGVYLELHYDTIQERYEVNGCRSVLAGIWEDAREKAPGSCQLQLSDEMFYFYHMAHMVKHFEVGGCGVRAYLDIWIMNHRMEFDRKKRQKLLETGGLLKFAKASEEVAEYWFSNAPADDMTLAISKYILKASLYGDNENRAALGQARMGGKVKYLLLRRVFMPYDYLKAEYPILKKHKWLTPVYQVVRWLRMLFSGRLGTTLRELKANAVLKETQEYSAADIVKYLDI